MTYFNFLTGKTYNADISEILEKYCRDNKIDFHGFATVTQARKQFIKVQKGAHGVKCPITIANAKTRYFYVFPLSAFTTCDDKRSKRAQKADSNSDQSDRVIRYHLPADMSESEKKSQIAAAQKLTKENENASLECKISTYDSYVYEQKKADKTLYKVSLDHRTEAEIKHEYIETHYNDVQTIENNHDVMQIDSDAYTNVDFVNAYIF